MIATRKKIVQRKKREKYPHRHCITQTKSYFSFSFYHCFKYTHATGTRQISPIRNSRENPKITNESEKIEVKLKDANFARLAFAKEKKNRIHTNSRHSRETAKLKF